MGACAIGMGLALFGTSMTPAAARSHHHRQQHSTYSPPQAAIIVDGNTGRVLYAQNADAERYPASLTKVMTLYLLFEALDRGRVTFDTPLTASKLAAAQAPSKLGMRPGETITVRDAIKAIVTKSANDVAMVIAENIGGSEAAFVRRMNETARSLGMSRTVYTNPNGLPDGRQHTTARDYATLARAVGDRFPRYFHFFSTRSFTWKGHVIPNHDNLLGRVDGVDGMKTGFIRASGFNLLTTAHKDGHSLIGVVFGGRSARERDGRMRKLVEAYLPKTSTGRAAPMVALATSLPKASPPVPMPAPAPEAAQAPASPLPLIRRVQTAVVEAPAAPLPPTQQPKITEAVARRTVTAPADSTLTPGAIAARINRATAMVTTTPPAMRWVVGPKPAATGTDSEVTAFASGATPDSEPALLPTRTGRAAARNSTVAAHHGWVVQIGATASVGQAEDLLAKARKTVLRVTAGAESFTESVQSGDATLYRARFGGFDDRQTAQLACAALKRQDMACFTAKD